MHGISPNINANNGQRVYIPDAGQGQIVCTHGHICSLFNAQDYTSCPSGYKGLPLGHFISRLAALWTAQELKKQGKNNSAQLPNNGDPKGWRFDSEATVGLLESVLEDKDRMSEVIMTALSEATGKADDSFTMYENKLTLNAVEEMYKSLYRDYPDSTKTEDMTISVRDFSSFFALAETDMDNKADHFAKELAKAYPVIVMGHTHVPVLHYDEFPLYPKALYANSGFWCPSVPDMQDKGRYPTFAEVEIEDGQFAVSVKQVLRQGDDYVIPSEPYMGPMHIAMR